MSKWEFLYNLDYDYRRAGSMVALAKIEVAMSENDYERALACYEELKHKMHEYMKDEEERGETAKEPPPEIHLRLVKAHIDLYFRKISLEDFSRIVKRSDEECKLRFSKVRPKDL